AGVFETVDDEGLDAVLIEQLGGAFAAAFVVIVEDAGVIEEDRFAEGAAVDEDFLGGRQSPDQIAAVLVGVEDRLRDVVLGEEIGGARGPLPGVDAELEEIAANSAHDKRC